MISFHSKSARAEEFPTSQQPLSAELIDQFLHNAYKDIGLFTNAQSLLQEADGWWVGIDDKDPNIMHWFSAYRITPYGKKIIYSGTDGSREGVAEFSHVRTQLFKDPNLHYYAEVSGSIERLLERSKTPKVPADEVQEIIKKPITILDDGFHYERMIGGSPKQKIMYGHPVGVSTGKTSEGKTDTVEESEAKAGLQNMHAHEGSVKTPAIPTMDDFTKAYIEAALWSTTDENEVSLDSNYNFNDIAPSTLQAMIRDCQQFQQQNSQLLEENGDEQGGHDFWLTRNRHNAGFWDGDWPMNGDKLTFAAKKYGEVDLYVGYDGYIYQSGTETSEPVEPREKFETTSEDDKLLKSMGVLAKVKNKLLMKNEPKLSFAFTNNIRKYDYAAIGNDVVLISPAHITKLLQGDEARTFWTILDGIEDHVPDETEYNAQVEALVKSSFDADLKVASQKYVVQVDASNHKKASITFITNVDITNGVVNSMRFTSRWAKAKMFSVAEANLIIAQLNGFRMRGALVKTRG